MPVGHKSKKALKKEHAAQKSSKTSKESKESSVKESLSSTGSLVDQWEKKKDPATQRELSPSKSALNEELDAVRKSRGMSPSAVKSLASAFNSGDVRGHMAQTEASTAATAATPDMTGGDVGSDLDLSSGLTVGSPSAPSSSSVKHKEGKSPVRADIVIEDSEEDEEEDERSGGISGNKESRAQKVPVQPSSSSSDRGRGGAPHTNHHNKPKAAGAHTGKQAVQQEPPRERGESGGNEGAPAKRHDMLTASSSVSSSASADADADADVDAGMEWPWIVLISVAVVGIGFAAFSRVNRR
jgi:hypothetical protein